jgi:hypothetical protein
MFRHAMLTWPVLPWPEERTIMRREATNLANIGCWRNAPPLFNADGTRSSTAMHAWPCYMLCCAPACRLWRVFCIAFVGYIPQAVHQFCIAFVGYIPQAVHQFCIAFVGYIPQAVHQFCIAFVGYIPQAVHQLARLRYLSGSSNCIPGANHFLIPSDQVLPVQRAFGGQAKQHAKAPLRVPRK